MRIVEQSKVCCDCKERKAFSDYYVRTRWENGSVRNVQARCKACTAVHRDVWERKHPERKRARQRRHTSEDLAIKAAQARDRYRAKHGVPPERYRPKRYLRDVNLGSPVLLDSGPFLDWLDDAPEGAVRSVGRVLSTLRHGQTRVSLDVVHRAAWEAGVSVEAIYGDQCAA